MTTADRRRPRPKQPHGSSTGHKTASGASRRHRPRLLERDDYLSELRALFSDDWDHPVGPIVVEGGTGVGKTAFLKAACQIAVDAGWTVLRARGDGLKERAAFGVVNQLLGSQAGGATEVTPAGGDATGGAADLDRLVKKLSAEQGVVIAVDDAHWSDEESSEWLYDFEQRATRRRG